MRRILTLLNEIVIDFFRSEINIINDFMLFFEKEVIVIELSWKRNSTNDFDLPAFVYEDVHRMNITYLFLQMLEFAAGSDNVIQ